MKSTLIPILLLTSLVSAGGILHFDKEKPAEITGAVALNESVSTEKLEAPTITKEPEKVETSAATPVALAETKQTATVTPAQKVQSNETKAGPKRLRIPSIGVDAHIEQVGLTSSNNMDAPAGPDNAGWYKYGVLPGEIGSAVIDGHSGWRDNIPAIFDNLPNVKVGDKIYVEGSDGTTTTFVVRDIREYGYNADGYEIFNSNDGKAHLNLITCAGEWNDIARSSLKRLVVFTDKVIN